MAAGLRTVKIKFLGDTKDLDRAAGAAKRSMSKISDGVKDSASGFGGIIMGGLKTPGIAVAAAVAGAALGTVLGVSMSAAIPLAFGGGALAIGIKAAANDPQVKAAWSGFTKTAKDVFSGFGKEFRGPVLEAIKVFDKTLKEMKPTFTEIAKATAPLVSILAPALAAMAKNSLPGIKSSIEASVPLFKIVAAEAPKLAKSFSDFLNSVNKNGPEAGRFLKDMFTFLGWSIRATGTLLGWLATQYAGMRAAVVVVVNALKAAWNGFYSFFYSVGTKLGSAINSVVSKFNSFRSSVTSIWNSVTSRISSAVSSVVARFNSFRSSITSAWNSVTSRISSGVSSVVGRFNSFRSSVAGVWNSITATISSAVSRIEGAWNRLRNLASRAINFSVGASLGALGGLLPGRAAGGPVSAGRTYLVGEKGPEIVTMGGNGSVTPNHKLGGDGGGPQIIELHANFAPGITQVFKYEINEHDRNLKRAVAARG